MKEIKIFEEQKFDENTIIIHDDQNNKIKYYKIYLLGVGCFGTCVKVYNEATKELFALKMITPSLKNMNQTKKLIMTEIAIHSKLRHRNIVAFKQWYYERDCFYILLELCNSESLAGQLKHGPLAVKDVQRLALQLLDGIEYLHKKGVIHRDLKPDNLFLKENELKIGDFGLAVQLSKQSEKRNTYCGTLDYFAPELIDEKKGYSFEIDIWSFGVILFELLTDKTTFESSKEEKTLLLISQGTYKLPRKMSSNAQSLIKSIFKLNPSERQSLKEIRKHPFFTSDSSFLNNEQDKTIKQCPLLLKSSVNVMENVVFTTKLKSNQEKNKIAFNFEKVENNFNADQKEINDCKSSNVAIKFNSNVRNAPIEFEQNGRKVHMNNVQSKPEVFIKTINAISKDYTSFVLSNSDKGFVFSDWTSIICKTNFEFTYVNFNCISKKERIIFCGNLKDFIASSKNTKINPIELKEILDSRRNLNSNNFETESTIVYVKNHIKLSHTEIFRLSNYVSQVFYDDNTQLIWHSKSKVLTYVNKNQNRKTFSLESALESNDKLLVSKLNFVRSLY